MPIKEIPFSAPYDENGSTVLRSETSPVGFNTYFDGSRSVLTRPGEKIAFDQGAEAGLPTRGIYYWEEQQRIYFINELTHSWSPPPYRVATDSLHSASTTVLNRRVSITANASNLFVAGGGKIYYGAADASALTVMADADAPTAVSHLAYIDGYLFANSQGTDTFYYSNVNAPTSWSALDFASTAGSPDIIKALHKSNRNLLLFGQNSLEVWENDGRTPWARTSGGLFTVGLGATWSVIINRERIFWLDNQRRFVTFQGGGITEIPCPLASVIEGLTNVEDCLGFYFYIQGQHFYVWNFVDSKYTLVYHENSKDWYQWNIHSTGVEYDKWNCIDSIFVPLRNCYFLSTPDYFVPAVIPTFDNAYDITTLSGGSSVTKTIRVCHKTPYVDHGTNEQKRSNKLIFRAIRGEGGSSDPKLMVRWNDDNRGWSQEHHVSLGKSGDTHLYGQLRRSGIYRSRQWEFCLKENVPFGITKVEEDFEVLR